MTKVMPHTIAKGGQEVSLALNTFRDWSALFLALAFVALLIFIALALEGVKVSCFVT
jgi:flagellar biogenesis protein FliO